MSVNGINLIWIVVKDLKEAVKFYTEVVGMNLESIHEQFGWAELIGKEGGVRMGIAQKNDFDNMAPGSNAVITLTVKNIEETKQDFIKKGAVMLGDIMEVPGHVKLQTLVDIDGNRLQIVESLNLTN